MKNSRPGEPSLPAGKFDPSTLQRYAVITAPIPLVTGGVDDKRLVVLGHNSGSLVCIKTTTDKPGFYAKRPELAPGIVVYEAKTVEPFEDRTIIDPHSTHTVAHTSVARLLESEQWRLRGVLPVEFHDRLLTAIRQSNRLDKYEKQYLGMVLKAKIL